MGCTCSTMKNPPCGYCEECFECACCGDICHPDSEGLVEIDTDTYCQNCADEEEENE